MSLLCSTAPSSSLCMYQNHPMTHITIPYGFPRKRQIPLWYKYKNLWWIRFSFDKIYLPCTYIPILLLHTLCICTLIYLYFNTIRWVISSTTNPKSSNIPPKDFSSPLRMVSNQKEQRRKNSLFFGNLKVTTLLRNNVRIAANGTVDHADGKWRGRRPFGMANAL